MKTCQRIAAVCCAIGVLGTLVPHGAAGFQRVEPDNKADSAAALYKQGKLYAQGEEVAQDDEEAAYYYRKAAEQGNARAQLSLGMMYASGQGVRKDFGEAVYWIHQSFKCAQLPWQDTAVAEAVSWLRQAAGHGYVPAQRTLELMRNSESEAVASRFFPRHGKPAGLGETKAQTIPLHQSGRA